MTRKRCIALLQVYCLAQELRRCEEELSFLPQDAANTLEYFEWQQQQLATALTALHASPEGAGLPPLMIAGRAHMLRAWQARIANMQREAAAAFAKVGWVVMS